LRAFERFTDGALARLGFESSTLFEGVRQFQRAHGLPEGRCDEMTLNRIWALLLGPSSDPAAVLADVGIAVNLETHRAGEQFGDIDAAGCGEGGQRIALGLSRSVSNQKAPGSVLATAQKQLLSTAKAGFDQFRSMNDSAAAIDVKVKAVAKFASEIQDEAAKTSETAEAALRVIDGLTVMNKEVEDKLALIQQRMGREIGRTNVLVVGLLTIGVLLFVQWFVRRRAS
jgi:tetrahydromethanopterin S-methyltransferase subunit G